MNDRLRLAEVEYYKKITPQTLDLLNELTEIATLICSYPICAISLVYSEKQKFIAKTGIDFQETPRNDSFSQYVLAEGGKILEINDTLKDERFRKNPYVLGNPGIRHYVGVPIKTSSGNILGCLSLVNTQPGKISGIQKKGLKIVAGKAMNYLSKDQLIIEQKNELNYRAEKLKKLTDEIPGVIYQFKMEKDGSMSSNFVSKGIERLYPELIAKEFKNNPLLLFDLIHKDDIMPFYASIEESFRNLTNWEFTFRVRREGDKIEWHLAKSRPEKQDDGSVVWYGFIQNITKIIEYEKKMEQLAFDISHVLRKPVATLLSLTSVMEEEIMSKKEIKKYSRHIKTVSEELDNYTHKLHQTYRVSNN